MEKYLVYPLSMSDDAVERLLIFRDKHPEVTITPPGPDAGPFWTAEENGEVVADSSYWLAQLMDKLDKKYS